MTRRLTPAARTAREALDAAIIIWDDFATEVRKAFKAAGRQLPAGSTTTRAIDSAIGDLQRAHHHAHVSGDACYADRAQHLAAVVAAMVSREQSKLRSDPKGWLNRHHGEVEVPIEKPRRRHAHAED